MFFTADIARSGEGIRLKHDHPLVAMNMTMFCLMLQTEIRGNRQLKNTAIAVVYPMALVRLVFVFTIRTVPTLAGFPAGQGVQKRLHTTCASLKRDRFVSKTAFNLSIFPVVGCTDAGGNPD